MLNHEIGRIDPIHRSLIALACLAGAFAIGSLNYTTYWFWFLPRTQNFFPSLISGIVALLLLLPVIRRDFLHIHKLNFLTVMNLLLVFYLTSVFAMMGIKGAEAFSMATQGPTFILTLLVIAMANLIVDTGNLVSWPLLSLEGGIFTLPAK